MKIRTFFVGACLAAAVLSVFASIAMRRAAQAVDANTAVATRTSSVEWPTHFRGRPLTQLALAPLDARFAHRFPGAIARFTDGARTLIVRRVDAATRALHPATDCFRAAGYATTVSRVQVDATGEQWRCFIGARGDARVRVCERIAAGRFDATQGYTDVSAWYWSALAATGPWWAITVISPLDLEAL